MNEPDAPTVEFARRLFDRRVQPRKRDPCLFPHVLLRENGRTMPAARSFDVYDGTQVRRVCKHSPYPDPLQILCKS